MGKTKKKKKKRLLSSAITLILFLAILVVFLGVVCQIKKITITGNDYCTKDEILEMMQNDRFSDNALYLYGKYKIGKGNKYSCLESVDVKLISPWEIKVTVKEKSIICYVKNGNYYVYFDEDGMVVLISEEKRDGLPKVSGINVMNAKKFEVLESGSDGLFQEIIETSKLLEKYGISSKKILYKDGELYVYIDNLRVNLGSEVSSNQIAQIPPILEKIGNKSGTLHLENFKKAGDSIPFKEEDISKKS